VEHRAPWDTQREELAEYLRQQRRLHNLTLRELASLTQLSNAYLSQLERGIHEPSLRVMRSLAGAYNISLASMLAHAGLYADDEPSPPGSQATAAAIRADPHLSEDKKEALLAVYRSYVEGD
jgi:transcriptional regulator with XRE-family HTH domain